MSNRNNPFSEQSSPFSKKPEPKPTLPGIKPPVAKATPQLPNLAPEPAKAQLPVLPDFGVKTSGEIPAPTLPAFPRPNEFKSTGEQRNRGNVDNLFPVEEEVEDFVYEENDDEDEEDFNVPTVEEIYEEMFGESLDPNVSYENLTAEEEEETERRLDAASSPAALPTLYALAEDKDVLVRSFVASNESTPASLLERLAKDSDSSVREAVMENEVCPDATYRAFAYDADDYIVASWIELPRTTSDMLVGLYETKNVYLASVLLDSPNVPATVKSTLKAKFSL